MNLKLVNTKLHPFVAGLIFAILFILTFYILDEPLGISEGYDILSDYFKKNIEKRSFREIQVPPLVSQTAFLGGILIGGLLGACMDGGWKLMIFPENSQSKGLLMSSWLSPLQGVVGGFFVMLGLQLAGDSFLGQWMGAVQLSTGSWIFLFSIMVWGVIFTGILSYNPPSGASTSNPQNKG